MKQNELSNKFGQQQHLGDEGVEVPSHYKKYTIQDRHILLQTSERQQTQPGTSYDGPENTKRIDLARPGEEAKPVYIASDLTPEEEQELIALLMEYREVFAWSYTRLERGRSFHLSTHHIDEGGCKTEPPTPLHI